ncbi:MULE transposase N-terminal all-beta domain [Arabidopsis suecica]|uniref:MULE transposase N-terminal all-beta domain n=1 Tax=Arabidopsis suecica TaxID=45249 RepID=A0A8T2FB29_ARASU|nr:MULE transposase N-terminal all-beta domain [Arabidopsis suecica]
MKENVIIYFKFHGRMYNVMMKTLGAKITLSMLKERIMTKLGLDANKVKLHMRYNPGFFGVEKEMNVCDDEDVFVYVTSSKNNRRSVLVVEEISKPPEPEQLPEQLYRVGKSSVGKNYTELNSEEDEMRVDDGALIVLLEEEQGTQHQLEAIVEEDHRTQEDETRYDESMDNSDRGEQYVESPPAVEPALHEVVDRAAFANSFGYVVKKSDKERYVLKCAKESCSWRLRASNISNTDIFSIRRESERDPYYDDLKAAKRAIEQMEMVAMMEGIPKFCPCGGSIVDTRKDEKRYYQCEKFKDDRNDLMHISKLWDKAMEEEVSGLRESVDYNQKKV